jgi:hypothetical protein
MTDLRCVVGYFVPGQLRSAFWALLCIWMMSCSGRTTAVVDGPMTFDLLAKDGGPHDVAADASCIPWGGHLYDTLKEKCCFNFIPVVDKISVWKGQCQEKQPRRYLCTGCGDGYCQTRETICNCPNDCKCYGEGDEFENLSGDPNQKCCSGFKAVKATTPTSAGTCASPSCDCFVCVQCGNGACGPGENECTCFADCSP